MYVGGIDLESEVLNADRSVLEGYKVFPIPATILFECTFPGGSTEQVGLTECEVDKFKKNNRATCVPATF